MSQCHVSDLVGHHARHLAFSARSFDHAAVHVHWTTWQREGVDVSRVDDFEVIIKFGVLKFRRDISNEPASYILHIAANLFVAQQGKLALGLLCSLTPELYVILNAVFVAVILD